MDQKIYDKIYHRRSRRFQCSKPRIQELVSIVKKYKPEKVLDVGCGLGYLVKALRKEGMETYGIDGSRALLEYWQEDHFKLAEAESLPFKDNEFDLAISTDFFEHIPEGQIARVLSEMKRVVEPKGVILAKIAMDRKLVNYQYIYHCTNKSEKWWKEKLPGVILC